jgi:YVTN family beta-propeller protein
MNRAPAGHFVLAIVSVLTAVPAAAQVDPAAYVNFEGAQTAPIRLSADGTRLFAVNTPDARLSVFDLAVPSSPRLITEIPVGLEPVSVNPRTNDEAWVVNQVSDSISVVSVSRGVVIDTIAVKDEPADVVFAQDKAFVSVSRNNQVRVFSATTHAFIASIPVFCVNPRALAVNAARTKVYTACALSGNRTTIVQSFFAPPQPSPTNPDLPPPPKVGLIVDALDPRWSALIRYRVADADVAEIDTRLLAVTRYFSGVGTINLGLAVQPFSGDLYVANTDARNLVRYEPNVRGHWVDNRVTRVQLNGPTSALDLNPTIDYSIMPNPAAQSIALAQPTAIAFEPLGRFFYVAAFGSDRVGMVDAVGNVLARIDLGPPGPGADSPNMRGPRGLALHAWAQRLFVLNRISNTISIVDITSNSVQAEIPVGTFDPTPTSIRTGRGFLYDAKLSGSGIGSCASCHVDGDMDMIAWDLGDPGGSMQTVIQNGAAIPMHPMKGPMTTQSLRGLAGLEPLHWRGDRADFPAFNRAFDRLMGASPLSDDDMAAFTKFINTLTFMPNPNQNLDRTLPTSFIGGDPVAGRNSFMNDKFLLGLSCGSCHKSDPGPGTSRFIQFFPNQDQAMKIPQLRNVYQKQNFSRLPGTLSMSGFGIEHDGSFSSIFDLLSEPVFALLSTDFVRKVNIAAFVECFDTGTAPAVGYTRTVNAGNLGDPTILQDWAVLEGQAAVGNIDLIVNGTLDGSRHGFLYRPWTDDYEVDSVTLGPFTRAQLVAKVAAGDTLSVMGTPPGSGRRMGLDRDLDGILNGDEAASAPARSGVAAFGRDRWWPPVQRALRRVGEWFRAAVA